MSVLNCLLFGCKPGQFVLNVFGGEEAEGANVFVNGELVGSLQKFGDKGVRFATRLQRGTLNIEVKKEGFSFRDVITVSSDAREHNVYVTLSLESKTNEDKRSAGGSEQESPVGDRPTPICPD